MNRVKFKCSALDTYADLLLHDTKVRLGYVQGPNQFIEEVLAPNDVVACSHLPPRENVKYWIGHSVNDQGKLYTCFCWQKGRWWKYKELQQTTGFDQPLIIDPQVRKYLEQIPKHYLRSFVRRALYNDQVENFIKDVKRSTRLRGMKTTK